MLGSQKASEAFESLGTTGEHVVDDGIVRVLCADNKYRDVEATLLMNSSTSLKRILSERSTSGDISKIEVPIKSAAFDLLVSYFSSGRIVLRSCLDAIQLNALARSLDLAELAQTTEGFIGQNFADFVRGRLLKDLSIPEMVQLQELPFLKKLAFDRRLFVEETRRWTEKERAPTPVDAAPQGRVPATGPRSPDRSPGNSCSRLNERRFSGFSTSPWMGPDSASDTSVAIVTEDDGRLRLFKVQETHSKEYSCGLSPSLKPSHPTDAVIVKDRLFFVDKKGLRLSAVSLRAGGLPETVVETGMNISHMAFFNERLYVSIVDEIFVLENLRLKQVGKSSEYILEFVILHHSESCFQFIHRNVELQLRHLTCERPGEITKEFKSFQADWLIGADGSRVFAISSKSPKELMVLQNFQRVSGLPRGDEIGRNSVCSRGQIFSCETRRDETFVNVLNVAENTTKRFPIKGRNPVLVLKASNGFKT